MNSVKSRTKGFLTLAGGGFLLFGSGVYSYMSDMSFVNHAIRSQATIQQVHEEKILASKGDWFGSGLQTAHECDYSIEFRPEHADADVVTQLKIVKRSGCVHSGTLVGIMYDPQSPQTVSFYTTPDQAVPIGKILMFFGVMIVGLAYFIWVNLDKASQKTSFGKGE
jgi:hypothetical protein